MSSAVTETATFPASISAPDDGDPRNAASVRTPCADLASRTKFLREQGPDLQPAYKIRYSAARAFSVVQFETFVALAADWSPITNAGAPTFINNIVGKDIYCPIRVPSGATITAIEVSYQGAAAHVGLPAVMPAVGLSVQPHVSGLASAIGASAGDTAASTAAFQGVHQWSKTGLATVVDNTANRYFAVVTAESSTNALVGAKISSIKVSYTLSAVDDAG